MTISITAAICHCWSNRGSPGPQNQQRALTYRSSSTFQKGWMILRIQNTGPDTINDLQVNYRFYFQNISEGAAKVRLEYTTENGANASFTELGYSNTPLAQQTPNNSLTGNCQNKVGHGLNWQPGDTLYLRWQTEDSSLDNDVSSHPSSGANDIVGIGAIRLTTVIGDTACQ